ncbi:MAG: hypothetical protein GJT30_02145 [Geobacter sp.]|nr:hypothetical protein [Geobacter sp.]
MPDRSDLYRNRMRNPVLFRKLASMMHDSRIGAVRHILFFLLCGLAMVCAAAPAHAADFSIAFFYAESPPVDELKAFDLVVVEPDAGLSPAVYGEGRSELFAYVSIGELDPKRSYAAGLEKGWIIGRNDAWGTSILDPANPAWRSYLLEQVMAPLWEKGYRGFFLDTLDSYQRAAGGIEERQRMEDGLAATIYAIRKRFPGAKLILNRGFEIFDRVRGEVMAVAAESLFQRFDPVSGTYGAVSEEDREWLKGQLAHIQKAGVPVIAIDYVPPDKRELARETAAKLSELGYIPWVADSDLSSLGVGAVEVVPRSILGIYDGLEGDMAYTRLHRFAQMPLNHLGYRLELHNLREPLPKGILAGRYAGVVVWPLSGAPGEQLELRSWVLERFKEQVPVAFLDSFGFTLADLPDPFGLQTGGQPVTGSGTLQVVSRDPIIGFESPPLPQQDAFVQLRLRKGRSLLKVSRGPAESDLAAITPWGGYALTPFALAIPLGEQFSWVVDPFAFFRTALRLPQFPVPDTTTENGSRLMLVHVDGDGFDSMAEWPGGKGAADELRTRILERYRVPTTVSVITGMMEKDGLYPKGKAADLVRQARQIFRLPWVEAASHSFSHPFVWPGRTRIEPREEAAMHNLPIAGYTMDLEREIAGSLRFIDDNLLPTGKKARLFFWTGDCTPDAEAVAATYRAGVGNMNGGSTLINESDRSLTAVAPLGIYRNGVFQVYAPNQNENVYTNLWQGPFYGYRRAIETFRLTDSPRRLKPMDIYYHFYSATKPAALKALEAVYDWALTRDRLNIFVSEYVETVLDFNRTVVARDLSGGWLVRNSGALREFRIPSELGYPDLKQSRNVAGFADLNDSRYLHIGPGGEAHIVVATKKPVSPYLSTLGGHLIRFGTKGKDLRMKLSSHTPFSLTLANADRCSPAGKKGVPFRRQGNALTVSLPEGNHELVFTCK